MATKVHDQDDDQDFAEVDVILAQAKLELHRDRKLRRNMNLSDIPENFAHVPSCPSTRPASLDTSQPDCASRAKSNQKLQHVLGLVAPIKWLRAYMGCLMALPQPPPPRHCVAG
jgi:hypothetical protein